MLEAALAAGVAEGGGDAWLARRAADAGRVDPRPPARPRPGRGRLRVPQPLAAQRDQVLRRRTGASSDDEAEAGIEARVAAGRLASPGVPPGGSASSTARSTTTCARCSRRFRLDLSGRRVLLDCANGATYRAAPSVFERLGCGGRDDRRGAGRAQHQRGLRLHPSGGAGRARRPQRRRDRIRLRRRRRPGDRGRRRGTGFATATS